MKCWSFIDSTFRTDVYNVELELFLIARGEWSVPLLEFTVDTGYDGDLLLSEETFDSLGFSLFEEDESEWDTGESVTGERFVLRSTRSEVRLDNSIFMVRLETFSGNVENLVGRGF